jgi:hypothetical protein
MATLSHESPGFVEEKSRRSLQVIVPEMWASLTTTVIWLTVLLDALFGPDIQTAGVAGDHAIVPSAVPIAFFAFFATWVVARYGFRHERKE